jgi:hypothetical protein
MGLGSRYICSSELQAVMQLRKATLETPRKPTYSNAIRTPQFPSSPHCGKGRILYAYCPAPSTTHQQLVRRILLYPYELSSNMGIE